jgi:hypothetical protein
MGNPDRGRRRVDRLTEPGLLDEIESIGVAELRTLRDECREEEAQLSYTRRLLQGRLDIARAERARREGGSEGTLIDALPSILADGPSTRPRDKRAAPLYAPQGGGRRSDDSVLDDHSLGAILDFDDEQIVRYLDGVLDEEHRISDLRRILLDRIDGIQAELVRRLRDGAVGVDDIVTLSVQSDRGQRGSA